MAGLLALSAVMAWPGRAEESTKHLLKVGSTGTTVELNATGTSAEVLIPVTVESWLAPKDILQLPEIYDVSLQGRHDAVFRDAIEVSFVPGETGRPKALKIKVDLGKWVETGTYTVVVTVRAKSSEQVVPASGHKDPPSVPPTTAPAPSEEKVDTLSFQLTHPAAALASVPALKLDLEGLTSWVEQAPALLFLREMTRRSQVTGLLLEDEGLGPVSVRRKTATQDGKVEPLALEAGGQYQVPLAVTGVREVGTYKGRVLVRAPQLAMPAEFDYEITVRHPRWMIFVALVLGLLVGQFLRTWLKARIELDSARAASLRQRGLLEVEAEQSYDADYRAALEKIGRDIADAEKQTPAEMNAAIQQAATDLQAARRALEIRRQDAISKGQALKELASRNGLLPEPLAKASAIALGAVRDAEQRVGSDPKGAGTLLDDARRVFEEAVFVGAGAWRRAILSLDPLAAGKAPLPQAISEKLKTPAAELQNSVKDIPDDDPSQAAPDILLKAARVSAAKAQQLCARLRELVIPLASEVAGVLSAKPKSESSIDALRVIADYLDKRWQGEGMLFERMASLYEDLIKLVAAMRSAIQANTEAGVNVTSLESYDYAAAAWQAIAAPAPAAKDLHPRPKAAVELGVIPPAVPGEPFRVPASGGLASLKELEVRTLSQLALERALQTVVIGIILVLGGYLAYSKTFVGTLTDYATLFFWAFATDLTMEAVERVTGPVSAKLTAAQQVVS